MSASITVPNLNMSGQTGMPFMPPNPPGSVGPVSGGPVNPSGGSNPTQYSTTWGGAPPTGSPGSYNFGNAQNPNPPMMPNQPFAGLPTTSMNPGSPAGQTPNQFNLTGRQDQRSLSELQKYYGEGIGSMIYQYLQSGGGFNSALTEQAVSAQVADMQQNIQRGLGNLDTQMGETGINPNSSAWALETGDYQTQAVKDENAITAQEFYNMWNDSQNRELSLLKDTANVNATGTANQGGFMDFLSSGLGLFNSGAGILGNFGVPGFEGF